MILDTTNAKFKSEVLYGLSIFTLGTVTRFDWENGVYPYPKSEHLRDFWPESISLDTNVYLEMRERAEMLIKENE